jgi:hypothetical protein
MFQFPDAESGEKESFGAGQATGSGEVWNTIGGAIFGGGAWATTARFRFTGAAGGGVADG